MKYEGLNIKNCMGIYYDSIREAYYYSSRKYPLSTFQYKCSKQNFSFIRLTEIKTRVGAVN